MSSCIEVHVVQLGYIANPLNDYEQFVNKYTGKNPSTRKADLVIPVKNNWTRKNSSVRKADLVIVVRND